MINLPILDELRAIRQRLAEAVDFDVEAYAATLCDVRTLLPGKCVDQPLFPKSTATQFESQKDVG